MTEKRSVYFVRHGHPDFPVGERWCLGRTDRPLGALGEMQGLLTGIVLKDKVPGGIYCSSLIRAGQTAKYISGNYHIIPGLEECGSGEWDGLNFQEIKERYPELYERRGADKTLPIPGAEDVGDALKRFRDALQSVLQSSEGDIAVVTHATVLGTFLAEVCGDSCIHARKYRIPYGAWIRLEYNVDGEKDGERNKSEWQIPACSVEAPDAYSETVYLNTSSHESAAPLPYSLSHEIPYSLPRKIPFLLPSLTLTPELCAMLQSAAGMSDRICAHCRAVAEESMRITDEIERSTEIRLDRNLLYCASLLHDIARLEKNHEAVGGEYIRRLGYTEAGDLIAQHDGPEEMKISEAAVLYIADKQIREDCRVTVEQRYAGSREKCRSPEALERHAAKLAQALEMKNLINRTCGKEIIL